MTPQWVLRAGIALLAAGIAAGCTSSTSTTAAPSPLKCAVTAALSPTTVGPGGGVVTATVSAARECAWTASSEASWIAITAGRTGQGDGTVTYEVAANPMSVPRRAGVAVNDERVELAQEAVVCQFTLDPTSADFGSQGGSTTVSVTAPSSCAWTATSQAAWIQVISGAAGSGGGTVGIAVDANAGPARTGTVTIAGHTFSVEQAGASAGPGCTFAIAPTAQTIGAGGGSLAVTVSTAGECAWTATSASAWLTVTGGSSGTGPGTVALEVAPNLSAAPRTGSATIAGELFTVQQEAAVISCTYLVAPTSASVTAGGEALTFAVGTTAGCAWDATSNEPWLSASPSSGTGPGTVDVVVAANTGTDSRSGTVVIAGQTVQVDQAGTASLCSYVIDPTQASVPSAGGSLDVDVQAPVGCVWTAISNDGWIDVVAGSAGTGDGTVELNVRRHHGENERTGTVTIAGQTFTVTQQGDDD
jgi:hypothetical protein